MDSPLLRGKRCGERVPSVQVEGTWHTGGGVGCRLEGTASNGQEGTVRGYRRRNRDRLSVLGYPWWSLREIKDRKFLRAGELQNFEASNEGVKRSAGGSELTKATWSCWPVALKTHWLFLVFI